MALSVKERKKRFVARWRYWLLEQLGFACATCGTDQDLQFDHPNGRDWKPGQYQRADRIRRYVRDFRAGNLRLLCGPHNRSDGGRRRWKTHNTGS